MKYCERCKVKIAGRGESCPLCGGYLDRIAEDEPDVFPQIPTIYCQYNLFFRLLAWISIIVVTVSLAVNYGVPQTGYWSLVVLGVVCSFWISLSISVRKRGNLSHRILNQLLVVSVLVILWDLLTGWHRWSIDYVIPILCVTGMGAMAILGRVMKQYIDDPILYLSIYGGLGMIPLIPLFLGWLNVIYPTLICVVISVISLSGVILFRGKKLRQELNRRMHV